MTVTISSVSKTSRAWPARWLASLALLALVACTTQPPQSAPASIAAPAPAPSARLGTQWGEGLESRVHNVNARRVREQPEAVASIHYARDRRGDQRQRNLSLAGGHVEWSVHDQNDQPMRLWTQRGASSFHIQGTEGQRYILVFRNLSDQPYEVVSTVDGIDVLSGQPGSLVHRGYVLRPQTVLRIEGFRKSQDEVAAFRFADPGRAYAANTPAGDARNIGVIGAAIFALAMPDAPHPGPGRSGPNPFPADAGAGTSSPYAPPPQYRGKP